MASPIKNNDDKFSLPISECFNFCSVLLRGWRFLSFIFYGDPNIKPCSFDDPSSLLFSRSFFRACSMQILSPAMDLLANRRARLAVLFLLLSFYAPIQEVGAENAKNSSIIPSNRRSKMFPDAVRSNHTVGADALRLAAKQNGGLFNAFFTSLSMILVSETGDETFIIAALMAMRHPKSIVLSGALAALIVMTALSTGLGTIVPNLISRKLTNNAATLLYLFFGLRLLYIAWRSDPKSSQKKELEEVEEKLDAGQGKSAYRRFFSRFCTPIFLESFVLTFLAEWGDRSQIATIALATHKNAVGVAVGATLGHTICTSVAVVGGSILASKISQRTVATIGGLLFLGFSLSSFFFPFLSLT